MEIIFAFALLNEVVIKPTAQGIIDDFKKGLEEDFETIYKPKGLNDDVFINCIFINNKLLKEK